MKSKHRATILAVWNRQFLPNFLPILAQYFCNTSHVLVRDFIKKYALLQQHFPSFKFLVHVNVMAFSTICLINDSSYFAIQMFSTNKSLFELFCQWCLLSNLVNYGKCVKALALLLMFYNVFFCKSIMPELLFLQ